MNVANIVKINAIGVIPLFLFPCAAFSSESYDYVWLGTSDGDFKWLSPSNWSPNGTPAEGNSVYIETTTGSGLAANSLDLGGGASVGGVTWVISAQTQRLYSGGALNAENFTAVVNANGWQQYCFGSALNVSKGDGTGRLLMLNYEKFDYSVIKFLANAVISADNIEIGSFNAWSGSISFGLGWNGGGSASAPIVKASGEMKIGNGAVFDASSSNAYVEFGGINGLGTVRSGGKSLNIKLAGRGDYEYGGVSDFSGGGGVYVAMDSAGSQKFTNSGFNLSGLALLNGRLEIAGSAGDVSLSGGALSSLENGSSGDVLNMSSLSWSGGKISLDLDAEMADSVSVGGDFSTSGSGELVFDLHFDDLVMREALESSDDGKISWEVVSVAGTSDISNGNFAFEDGYGTFYYAFEGGVLTISLNPIPEPALCAAFLALMAAGVVFRRALRR